MNNNEVIDRAVSLVKQREGILNNVQDSYIKAIVEGVISELENEHDIMVDMDSMDMFMFVVDMASYRYSNRDSLEGMSKHLEYRLKTFYIQR
ncbi:hypothetical protein [Anaerococcus sp. AGMB09787]|uniref:hypothetical protein n=1 Tax=Anaerococcus sp. AGMB09787 TaxID=2922869 RepID=UPI001FAED2C0|nr:hypothetical protein [Anaerococcus sp. AGMB09787]